MVKIANFSSVFEIAFGLNAVLYVFDLIPHTEDRLKSMMEEHAKLYDRKVKVTNSTESFPIGFFVSATYPFYKRIFSKITVFLSTILLGLLVYSGFQPEFQITAFQMTVLLTIVFGIPLGAFLKHRST